MLRLMLRLIAAALTGFCATFPVAVPAAQSYPVRLVKLVVPAGSGGPTDIR